MAKSCLPDWYARPPFIRSLSTVDDQGHIVASSNERSIGRRIDLEEYFPGGTNSGGRPCDTLARLGGDEFVLLLPNIRQEEDGLKVADKIRYSVALPFLLQEHRVLVSASIGVAFSPDHAGDEHALMRCGDQAMYQVRAQGGDPYAMYRQIRPQAATATILDQHCRRRGSRK